MATCPVCRKRPAKRACPALSGAICSICCARERMINLQCPESCGYLQSARKAGKDRHLGALVSHALSPGVDPIRFLEDKSALIVLLDETIVGVQRDKFPGLMDQDIGDGIDAAIKTVHTLGKGVIYEHQASSAASEAVKNALLAALDNLRDDPEIREFANSDAPELTLKFMRKVVEYFSRFSQSDNDNAGGREYLRFTSMIYPYPEKPSSLILLS